MKSRKINLAEKKFSSLRAKKMKQKLAIHAVASIINLSCSHIWFQQTFFLIGPYPASIDICLQCSNDRKQERRRKSMFYDPFFRDCPAPSENRLIAFPKKPSPSQDSNPAHSDRMPPLYNLRHHHCLPSLKILEEL